MDNPFTKLEPVAKAYQAIKTKMPALFATIGQHSVESSKDQPKMPSLFATIGKHSTAKSDNIHEEKDLATWEMGSVERAHFTDLTRSAQEKMAQKFVTAPHQHLKCHDEEGTAHEYNVHEYTRSSRRLNRALHTCGGDIYSINPAHETEARRMTEACDFKSKKAITVYSGLHVNPQDHFNDDDEHTTFHHPAFLSTTTCPGVASYFGEAHVPKPGTQLRGGAVVHNPRPMSHILRLHVPKGSRAISVSGGKYIDGPENKYREQEVLIQRGAHIKIHKTPSKFGDCLVWHGELVGHSYTQDSDKLD